MAKKNQDDITRDMLNKIRSLQASEGIGMLNESVEGGASSAKSDAIAITDDPRFGQNVLTNQIMQFRSAVESGAQFMKPNSGDVSNSPLIYIPSENNLIFSGIIPCLNNLKWQFKLKTNTGNGCFLWADGLVLSKENIAIINKLFGFYKNWVDQWNIEATDLEKMANHLQND